MHSLDEQTQAIIAKTIGNRWWRLNNLYTIIPKHGPKRIMKLNKAQYAIFNTKHNRKVIPKSRQQGVSTYAVADALDRCITIPNYQAGIQSYGQIETDKLAKKAKLMWEDMDPDIKTILGIKLIASSETKGMEFSNGSVLRIGNFRGDTLNYLHISELAKIGKAFPAKEREIKTGAFQAVSKDNEITVESTSEGPAGLFYELCMSAKALQEAGAELTPLDFALIFIGWVDDPDCTMEQRPYIPEHKQYIITQLDEYFKKLEGILDIKLTQEQKNWYISKYKELGEDTKREYPATIDEAFDQSVEGAILKTQYNTMVKEKRIQPNLFKPEYPVTVSFDIGVNDETVMHFGQYYDGSPKLVNTYVNSGVGIAHYVAILEELRETKHYMIEDVILPHDGNVTSFSTGKTRVQTFRELGIPARVIPKTSELDGVEALRQLLDRLWIDQSLDKTIKAIQLYRWKVDRQLKVTIKIPVHDWTSNYMKSLQYLAQGWDYAASNIINLDYDYSGV